MGYLLAAFICGQDDAKLFTDHYLSATIVCLDQGIALVPLTDELANEIDGSTTDTVDAFDFINTSIETTILKIFGDSKIAYVTAEYHGGEGGQTGVLWEQNRRALLLDFGQDRINEILKRFGVVAGKHKDEFSTLYLGRYRNTEDWVR